MDQDTNGLPIFLEKFGFVFLLPKGFNVHISLGTFVFFLNCVQVPNVAFTYIVFLHIGCAE
jgi:hypothetical protein